MVELSEKSFAYHPLVAVANTFRFSIKVNLKVLLTDC